MQPEVSLPFSQEPATCSYPVLDLSSSQIPKLQSQGWWADVWM
jgi:hypothetical protein